MKTGDPLRLFGKVYRGRSAYMLIVDSIHDKTIHDNRIENKAGVQVSKLTIYGKAQERVTEPRGRKEQRNQSGATTEGIIIGEVKSEDGRIQEAKAAVEEEIHIYTMNLESNPYDADIYMNRGNAYLSIGDNDQAINDYSKAIELNPKYGEAFYQRARAYYNKKDYERSRQDIDQARKLGMEIDRAFLDELQKSLSVKATK